MMHACTYIRNSSTHTCQTYTTNNYIAPPNLRVENHVLHTAAVDGPRSWAFSLPPPPCLHTHTHNDFPFAPDSYLHNNERLHTAQTACQRKCDRSIQNNDIPRICGFSQQYELTTKKVYSPWSQTRHIYIYRAQKKQNTKKQMNN